MGKRGVQVALGTLEEPRRVDWIIYTSTMLMLTVLGLIGMILHVNENLIAKDKIVTERFIRGAPFLAPMLFADMGALGLIALLDPRETRP
jgi:hypothetical protein